MLTIPVYDTNGRQVRSVEVDEAVLGGRVRRQLLRDALIMYEANRRVGTRAAKTRGAVAGANRKMYRQKGTGYARAGSRRSPVRRGGGVAKTIAPRDYRQRMPIRARRLALASALLAKIQDGEACVIDGLHFAEPKTKEMKAVLDAMNVASSFLLVLGGPDRNAYLSARNIPGSRIRPVTELNAYDVVRQQRLIFTPEALEAIVERGRADRESA